MEKKDDGMIDRAMMALALLKNDYEGVDLFAALDMLFDMEVGNDEKPEEDK